MVVRVYGYYNGNRRLSWTGFKDNLSKVFRKGSRGWERINGSEHGWYGPYDVEEA